MLIQKDATFTPAPYVVYQKIFWYPSCGFEKDQVYILRLAGAYSLEQARDLIEQAKRDDRETYGGLIDPGPVSKSEWLVFHIETAKDVSSLV